MIPYRMSFKFLFTPNELEAVSVIDIRERSELHNQFENPEKQGRGCVNLYIMLRNVSLIVAELWH